MKGGMDKSLKVDQLKMIGTGGEIMHVMRTIAYAVVIVGAILFALMGFFNYNLISAIFGDSTVMSRILYSIIGVAGIVLLATPQEEECYCDCTDNTYL